MLSFFDVFLCNINTYFPLLFSAVYALKIVFSISTLRPCLHIGLHTGVDKGGPGGPAPPIAGPNFFLVKTGGLSSLPPAKSGRVCYDNPTGRGSFYQMSNMYTCIAYLIEIRKFSSKNLVHKGVNFEAQNALKLTYEHP